MESAPKTLSNGIIAACLTAILAAICVFSGFASGAQTGDRAASGVANAVDSIVQSRFHRVTPGEFGEHALFGQLGESAAMGRIDPFRAETSAERATLDPALQSGRTVVIGILHCRYKPDRDVQLYANGKSAPFTPAAEAVECVAASQSSSIQALKWARAHIGAAAMPGYAPAMRGNPLSRAFDGYEVSVRPVTAHSSVCLACHHGVKVGDTLAAIVYLVSKTPAKTPSVFVARQLDP